MHWKREWESRRQFAAEADEACQQTLHHLRRCMDYIVIGAVNAGLVLLAHLLDSTLNITLTLSGLAMAFTILALRFSERSEEEKMVYIIDQIIHESMRKERGRAEDKDEAESTSRTQ